MKSLQQTSIQAYMRKAKPTASQMAGRKIVKRELSKNKRKHNRGMDTSQESSQESVSLVQMETKAQVHRDSSPRVI